jgi:hypothetical protein
MIQKPFLFARNITKESVRIGCSLVSNSIKESYENNMFYLKQLYKIINYTNLLQQSCLKEIIDSQTNIYVPCQKNNSINDFLLINKINDLDKIDLARQNSFDGYFISVTKHKVAQNILDKIEGLKDDINYSNRLIRLIESFINKLIDERSILETNESNSINNSIYTFFTNILN